MCIKIPQPGKARGAINATDRNMTDQTFNNATITETVFISAALSGNSIGSMQAVFLLTEADYIRLNSQGNSVKNWANSFLFVTIGSAVTMAQNSLKGGLAQPDEISSGDLWVLSALAGLTVLLYVVGLFVPNEKKKTMKRIDDHFKSSPRSNHVVRAGE